MGSALKLGIGSTEKKILTSATLNRDLKTVSATGSKEVSPFKSSEQLNDRAEFTDMQL